MTLDAPAPVYPQTSIRLSEEGRVLCALEIDSSGQVTSVVIETSSGHRRLDRAAIESLRRWRFAPARRDSIAIVARIRHTVVFELH